MAHIRNILPKRTNAFDGQKAHNDNAYYVIGRVTYNSWATEVLEAYDIIVFESELVHIWNRHHKELQSIGMDAFDFVKFVVDNYSAIYQGKGNSYLLVVIREHTSDMAAIELFSELVDGRIVYKINTADPIETRKLYSKVLLCANDR